MTWVAQLGSTLLIPSGGCDHLHIVCSDPMNFSGRSPGSCLLVNISTVVPKCDRTLVLNVGDHPFISRESFVYYRKAYTEAANTLQTHVANGVYHGHSPADRMLVRRIVASMNASDFTPGDMLRIATQVWNGTKW